MMRNLGLTIIVLCVAVIILCIRLILVERKLDKMQSQIEYLIMDIDEHGKRILSIENRVTTIQINRQEPINKGSEEVKRTYMVGGLTKDWRK